MKLLLFSILLILVKGCNKKDNSTIDPNSGIEKGLLENQRIAISDEERAD